MEENTNLQNTSQDLKTLKVEGDKSQEGDESIIQTEKDVELFRKIHREINPLQKRQYGKALARKILKVVKEHFQSSPTS